MHTQYNIIPCQELTRLSICSACSIQRANPKATITWEYVSSFLSCKYTSGSSILTGTLYSSSGGGGDASSKVPRQQDNNRKKWSMKKNRILWETIAVGRRANPWHKGPSALHWMGVQYKLFNNKLFTWL